MRRWRILLLIMSLAPVPVSAADPAAPAVGVSHITDVIIGSPRTTMLGHAVCRPDGLLAFQTYPENEIWFCQIHPKTGALIPANGKGTYVGKAAPFVGDPIFLQWIFRGRAGTVNGPEWGNNQSGVGLYFTMVDKNGIYQLAKYPLTAARPAVRPISIGGYQDRYGNLPSRDAGDSRSRVAFIKQTVPPPFVVGTFPQRTYWKFDDIAAPEQRIPLDVDSFNGPRWVPGEHAITTFVKDAQGTIQVAKFHTDTSTLEFLTTGPERHAEAEIVINPATGQATWMTCIEDFAAIAVYELQAGSWVKINTVRPVLSPQSPSAPPAVFAVKPFVVRGKLYFFYNVFFGDQVLDIVHPIDIYLGSADGTINQRLTSAGWLDHRLNPQYFIGVPDNRVHLFYNTSLPLPVIANFGKFHRLSFTID